MLGAECAYRRRRKARETLVTPPGPHPGDGHLWLGGEWTPATGNLVQVPACLLGTGDLSRPPSLCGPQFPPLERKGVETESTVTSSFEMPTCCWEEGPEMYLEPKKPGLPDFQLALGGCTHPE